MLAQCSGGRIPVTGSTWLWEEGLLAPCAGGEEGLLALFPGGEEGLLAPLPGGEAAGDGDFLFVPMVNRRK